MVWAASRRKVRDEEKAATMPAPVWIWEYFCRELEKKDSALLCYHTQKWKSDIKRIRLKTEKDNRASDFYLCDDNDMSFLIWAKNFCWSLFSAHKPWVSPEVYLKLSLGCNLCLSMSHLQDHRDLAMQPKWNSGILQHNLSALYARAIHKWQLLSELLQYFDFFPLWQG